MTAIQLALDSSRTCWIRANSASCASFSSSTSRSSSGSIFPFATTGDGTLFVLVGAAISIDASAASVVGSTGSVSFEGGSTDSSTGLAIAALGAWPRGVVGWVAPEAFGLGVPLFGDELERREAAQGLEPSGVVAGGDEVLHVLPELLMAAVVVAPDGGVLDGPVHPFDLPVGPGMVHLGLATLDAVLVAGPAEDVGHGVAVGRLVNRRAAQANWMPLSVSTVWIV